MSILSIEQALGAKAKLGLAPPRKAIETLLLAGIESLIQGDEPFVSVSQTPRNESFFLVGSEGMVTVYLPTESEVEEAHHLVLEAGYPLSVVSKNGLGQASFSLVCLLMTSSVKSTISNILVKKRPFSLLY